MGQAEGDEDAKRDKSRPKPGHWAVPLALAAAVGTGALVLSVTSDRAPEEPASPSPREPLPDSGSAHLESVAESAQAILSQILSQESKKDATCWSSVRMIEGFSLGRQLDPAAEIARIEVSRALLERLWLRASAANENKLALSEEEIQAALPEPVKKAIDELEVAAARAPDGQVVGQAAQGMTDQQKTTENWRALLSLLISEAYRPLGLKKLTVPGAEALAKVSTAMTSLVLREAAAVAEKKGHENVHLEDVQRAHKQLVQSWFPSPHTPSSDPVSQPDELSAPVFRVARDVTMKNAAGKLEALARYNKLEKAPTFEQAGALAPYLTEVMQVEIAPEAAAKVAQEVRAFARLFLAAGGPLRSDTFSDSVRGLKEHERPRRILTLAHAFNATQDLFPTKRLPNADAEVLMTRNIIKKKGEPSVIDERRVSLEAPSLDAVRDTGIHWLSLRQALEDDPHVALDPFAAELLSETLSEYAYFLLEGAVRGAQAMKLDRVTGEVIDRLPWKYPLGRFFPVEDPGGKKEAAPGPQPSILPEFRERPLPASVQRAAAEKCTQSRQGFQGFMGSGVAVGDYDADGRPDLFVAADGCNRLLHNDGNFTFSDRTEAARIANLGATSRHPIFVDVDGDGALDLFVTQSGAPARLFLQKEGSFIDATEAWKLETAQGAHSATFFDYDQDGDLDLFIGHYGPSEGNTAIPTLNGRNGYANQLLRNEGTRFTDVSKEAGLDSTAWTLASAAVDIDQDGDLDLWLANDFGRDQVFLNLGGGKFRDIAAELRTDDRGSGMNVSVFDLNRDAKPDVFVSMIEMFSKTLRFVLPHGGTSYEVDDRVLSSSYYISGMKLFTSGGAAPQGSSVNVSFLDESEKHIDTGRKGWAWGAVPFDYDLDGDLDLFLANGWIEQSAFFSQYNQFMVNHEGRLATFGPTAAAAMPTTGESAAPPAFPNAPSPSYAGSSRAVAAADLNGSGKQDLIVVDYEGGLRVFENTSRSTGTPLRISLQGKGKNKHAVGASVRVDLDEGPPLVGYVTAGSDYLAQAELPLFFGVPIGRKVKAVVVTWPGGQSTTYSDVSGQKLQLAQK